MIFPDINSARAAASCAASTIASTRCRRWWRSRATGATRNAYTLGHSMGGMTAIFTAALDPDVIGTIAIATGYGRPTSLETLQKVGVADFRASYVVGVTLPELVADVDRRYDELLAAARRTARAIRRRRAATGWSAPAACDSSYDRAPEPKAFVDDRERSHLCRRARARRRARMAERTARQRRHTHVNARELRRYSRHLLIPEVGLAGQERLRASRVLVIGAGGLGSPALQYLAAAGVGRIGIVDDDTVDETNLQRQTIFSTTPTSGKAKATVAAERLARAQSADRRRRASACASMPVTLANSCGSTTSSSIAPIAFRHVILINDACFLEKRPDVYGSIFRFDGQVSVFAAPGPCYRCLYPEAPPWRAVRPARKAACSARSPVSSARGRRAKRSS